MTILFPRYHINYPQLTFFETMRDVEDWTKVAEDLILASFSEDEVDVINSQSYKALKILAKTIETGVPDKTVISILFSLKSYLNDEDDGVHSHDQNLLPLCNFFTSSQYTCYIRLLMIQFINLLITKGTIGDEENLTDAMYIEQAILRRDEAMLATVLPEDLFRFWEIVVSSIVNNVDRQKEDKFKESSKNSFKIDPDNPSEAILTAGDYAAETIYSGADFLKKGLSRIIPKVTDGIEHLGEVAKKNIEPHEETNQNENNEELEDEQATGDIAAISVSEQDVVAFSKAAVNATDVFRSSAQAVTTSICNVSTQGLNTLGKKWEENQMGEELCPGDELRASFVAIGKVGMATVGATFNVAEAILDATKSGELINHQLWLPNISL